MSPRSRLKAKRRSVFLGCEGKSEQSYGVLLHHLIDGIRKDIHIAPSILRPGGGDPLALVERAALQIKSARKLGTEFEIRALLLDSDRCGQNQERDRKAIELAGACNLILIWQRPCHEALLLNHFEGRNPAPRTSDEAMKMLLERWVHYRKGLPYVRLRDRISWSDVERAASIDPGLAQFLRSLGFEI